MLKLSIKNRHIVNSVLNLTKRSKSLEHNEFNKPKSKENGENSEIKNEENYRSLLDAAQKNLHVDELKLARQFTKLALKFYSSKSIKTDDVNSVIDTHNKPVGLAELFLKEKRKDVLKIPANCKVNEQEYNKHLLFQYCLTAENPGKMKMPGNGFYEEFCQSQLFSLLFEKDMTSKSYVALQFAMLKTNQKLIQKKKKDFKKKEPEPGYFKKICLGPIYKQYRLQIFDQKDVTASRFNQPVIVDLRYKIDVKHLASLEKQLSGIIQLNRCMPSPFHLIMSNCNPDLFNHLQENRNILPDTQTISDQPFLGMEGIDKEDLIYLSPDASEEMTTFDHNKVYIIGGIIDHAPIKYMSKTVAMNENISMQRFPLQKYLKWGSTASKLELTLNKSFEILQILKETDSDWLKALASLPIRSHRGLSLQGKVLANYDPEIVAKFDISHDVYARKKQTFRNALKTTSSPVITARKFFGHSQ